MKGQLREASNGAQVYVTCGEGYFGPSWEIHTNKTAQPRAEKNQKIPCETYYSPTFGTRNPPVIYGGHLYYSSLLRTLQLSHQEDGPSKARFQSAIPRFTCFTILRERECYLEMLTSSWHFSLPSCLTDNFNCYIFCLRQP